MAVIVQRGVSVLALFAILQVCAYRSVPEMNWPPPGDTQACVRVNGSKVLEAFIGYHRHPDKQWERVVEKLKLTECDEFSSLKIPKDSLKTTLIADPDHSIVFDVPFGGLLYLKELEIERVGEDKWKILLPKGSDRQRWVNRGLLPY